MLVFNMDTCVTVGMVMVSMVKQGNMSVIQFAWETREKSVVDFGEILSIHRVCFRFDKAQFLLIVSIL